MVSQPCSVTWCAAMHSREATFQTATQHMGLDLACWIGSHDARSTPIPCSTALTQPKRADMERCFAVCMQRWGELHVHAVALVPPSNVLHNVRHMHGLEIDVACCRAGAAGAAAVRGDGARLRGALHDLPALAPGQGHAVQVAPCQGRQPHVSWHLGRPSVSSVSACPMPCPPRKSLPS